MAYTYVWVKNYALLGLVPQLAKINSENKNLVGHAVLLLEADLLVGGVGQSLLW